MEMKFTSDITVKLINEMGGDFMVVAAAKVSTSGKEAVKLGRCACPIHSKNMPEWETCEDCKPYREQKEANYGLIKYLMKMRHGTPFEHSALTFFVHAPIFVWREWHRHRFMSYNEESGRYKQLDPVFYIPPRDRPMMKVEDWKPGRPKFKTLDEYAALNFPGDSPENIKWRADNTYENIVFNFKTAYKFAYEAYQFGILLELDPGLARDCLPVGIYSSCWVTCNPRSLMAFLSLRTYDETAKYVSYPLYEIEVAAKAVEDIFREGWPQTHRAFLECGRVAP